jgi:Terpene cyclase DEP1
MRLRHLYLALCVVGIVAPYAQFIPWLAHHGLQLDLFVRELFATRIGTFFGLDVLVSAIVLFVFIFGERRATAVRHVWLPIVATLIVGVSLGLPLFLYMRERARDAAKTTGRHDGKH